MKIFKRVLVCFLVLFVGAAVVFLLNGFKMQNDMVILSFTNNDKHINIKVGSESSSGYVRALRIKEFDSM